MPSASTLTRRPAPGVLLLGFRAGRIAADKNRPAEPDVLEEKLFNAGKIRHHAPRFQQRDHLTVEYALRDLKKPIGGPNGRPNWSNPCPKI